MDPHIQISFKTRDPAIAEVLIAELSEIEFDGFGQCDQRLDKVIPEEMLRESASDETIEKFSLEFEKKRIPKQNRDEQW